MITQRSIGTDWMSASAKDRRAYLSDACERLKIALRYTFSVPTVEEQITAFYRDKSNVSVEVSIIFAKVAAAAVMANHASSPSSRA